MHFEKKLNRLPEKCPSLVTSKKLGYQKTDALVRMTNAPPFRFNGPVQFSTKKVPKKLSFARTTFLVTLRELKVCKKTRHELAKRQFEVFKKYLKNSQPLIF